MEAERTCPLLTLAALPMDMYLTIGMLDKYPTTMSYIQHKYFSSCSSNPILDSHLHIDLKKNIHVLFRYKRFHMHVQRNLAYTGGELR